MATRKSEQGLFAGLNFTRGFVTATVGLLIANAIALVLGFLAKSLQDPVDTPIFNRIDRAGTNGLTDVLETVTTMGNVPQTQLWSVIAAVVLAIWFARRGTRWWMPLLVFPVAWIGARGFQMIQAKVVGRERGVTALIGTEVGSWPSGGVARIVLVAGLVAFLIVYYLRTSRQTTILLYSAVAVIGVIEMFARGRLNQHWFTDVIGGFVYGVLLLMVAMATIRAFDPDPPGYGPKS